MCGIVGYGGNPGAIDESLFVTMRDSIFHRGPDAAGLWRSSDGRVVFGHRRLAILDLTPSGAQPMVSEDGRIGVIFNGEIYNHEELRQELIAKGITFSGRSDTEVLLAAYCCWNMDCVQRLRGMFAFAIYDANKQILFIARDRAGEKPLFWTRHRGGLAFASELKAFMADAGFYPKLSPQGLDFYLTYGYVPGEYCILDGVHKLQPAHCLTWSLDTNTVTISRYWDIPSPNSEKVEQCEALVDELQSILTSSIQEQLVADVPIAVLLSGGVDSSIVTALAASVSDKPVRTFTVGVPAHAKFDESRFARRIADYFGTDHLELPLDSSSLDLISVLAKQYDEPIADSSMIPTYLLAKTVSQHCKVVLGGDGADELFGGYRAYQGNLQQEKLRRLLPSQLRSVISWGAENFLPVGTNKRNGLIGLRGELANGIAQMAVMLDLSHRHELSPWLAKHDRAVSPEQWRNSLVEPERGIPGAAMATDFRTYLPEDILVKVDRASMLCSLEVRAPFLDHRIIEFAYSRIPNALRASAKDRKILLKALAQRLLPADHDIERKQGFSIPLSNWLTQQAIAEWREECREQIRSILSEQKLEWIIRNLNEWMSQRLFSLMVLTWWMRHYKVQV